MRFFLRKCVISFFSRRCTQIFPQMRASAGKNATEHLLMGKILGILFAFEGAFGTALPSLIDQTPAYEFVQTIEKSELLKISGETFFIWLKTFLSLQRFTDKF